MTWGLIFLFISLLIILLFLCFIWTWYIDKASCWNIAFTIIHVDWSIISLSNFNFLLSVRGSFLLRSINFFSTKTISFLSCQLSCFFQCLLYSWWNCFFEIWICWKCCFYSFFCYLLSLINLLFWWLKIHDCFYSFLNWI